MADPIASELNRRARAPENPFVICPPDLLRSQALQWAIAPLQAAGRTKHSSTNIAIRHAQQRMADPNAGELDRRARAPKTYLSLSSLPAQKIGVNPLTTSTPVDFSFSGVSAVHGGLL
jgi:hypothetical protein